MPKLPGTRASLVIGSPQRQSLRRRRISCGVTKMANMHRGPLNRSAGPVCLGRCFSHQGARRARTHGAHRRTGGRMASSPPGCGLARRRQSLAPMTWDRGRGRDPRAVDRWQIDNCRCPAHRPFARPIHLSLTTSHAGMTGQRRSSSGSPALPGGRVHRRPLIRGSSHPAHVDTRTGTTDHAPVSRDRR
jgi:hypothetical protein